MTHPTIPDSLPWQYDTSGTRAVIVEQDGTTVAMLDTLKHSTAHGALEEHMAYMVYAANQLPRLQDELASERTANARKSIAAVDNQQERDQLRAQVAELERSLRAVRRMIDGSQPKDQKGAVMVIDAALAPATVAA